MSKDVTPLPDDVATCQSMICELLETLDDREHRIEHLEHQLDQLLRRLHGPKRERFDPNQGVLFDPDDALIDVDADKPLPGPEDSKAVRRHRHGRRQLPQHLERRQRSHTLLPHELACPCCGEDRIKIGEEPSEQLEYEPASLYVVLHVREKFACKNKMCEGHVVTAPKPPQPIEKGLAGPGLLAHIITCKFGDHLPWYRQEEVLQRHGVSLSRSTLWGWARGSSELLTPLYALMVAEVLKSRIIWTDDTPMPVLDPRLGRTRQARLWVYCGDRDHRISVYHYTATRKRDGPAKFLQGYRGYLQADAYGGYDGIYAGGDVVEVACGAHMRRKFFDAKSSAPQIAHEALARFGQLYTLERNAKHSSDEERLQMRQTEAVPRLAAFHVWLQQLATKVLPKSKIAEAVSYALNQWEAFIRYCDDPELTIDNNLSERTLRPCTIGRKNFLFFGNDGAGVTAAILYSMTASCKANSVHPFAYLRDVLEQLPRIVRDRRFLPLYQEALGHRGPNDRCEDDERISKKLALLKHDPLPFAQIIRDGKPLAIELFDRLSRFLPNNWLEDHPDARLEINRRSA